MAHMEACNPCRIAVSDAAFDAMETKGGDDDESIKVPEPLEAGAIVNGRYRVEGVLGRGAMGTVYSAHTAEGYQVAVKVMAHTSSSSVARFLREAATCARLTSEHVARVYESGRLPSGAPYLVMERLVGHDLGALMKHGALPIGHAALYAVHACRGLAEAHAIGVVHRDVKPENLFVTTRADGSPLVKVLDFGVSKIVSANLDGESSLTATQALLGTPSYMAPEQLVAAKNVDARADVWSIGVVVYQMIGGRLPFGGGNVLALMHQTSTTTPPALSSLRAGVPEAIERCVGHCLEAEPLRRYARILDVADALAPFAAAR